MQAGEDCRNGFSSDSTRPSKASSWPQGQRSFSSRSEPTRDHYERRSSLAERRPSSRSSLSKARPFPTISGPSRGNAGPFSRNPGPSPPSVSPNAGPNRAMISGRGADDLRPLQVAVAALADPEQPLLAAARVLPGHQPQLRGQVSTRGEGLGVAD